MSYLSSLSPRASSSSSVSSLLLAPSRRLKSKKASFTPSKQIPVVNPNRLTKGKQAKVLLLEDLKNFGQAGDIISANRLHALQLKEKNIGAPINTTFYGQPSIATPSQRSVKETLHEPAIQAMIADRVPAFNFFANLPSCPNSRRGDWSRGMPKTTSMTRMLEEKAAVQAAREAELRSLGWRPQEECEHEDLEDNYDDLVEDEPEAPIEAIKPPRAS